MTNETVTSTREAMTALLESQKASDAITLVLEGVNDKLHANGLSGAVWAIEAILANMASFVDPAIERMQAEAAHV